MILTFKIPTAVGQKRTIVGPFLILNRRAAISEYIQLVKKKFFLCLLAAL